MNARSDAAPTLTELKLSPEMRNTINKAAESGHPISIAYVNDAGEPALSFRGSTQAYSDTQLAIWVRNPESGLVKATSGERPTVALIYGKFDPDERALMVFRGRAHVDNGDDVRRRVYESAPKFEQDFDPERKGVPLIIDLDSVDGFFGSHMLRMRR